MNIRFMVKTSQFNGFHLKDDIVLEKEYYESDFENVDNAKYYIYRLETNERDEIMPLSNKIELFTVVNCVYRSDSVYFIEYEKVDEKFSNFYLVKYNFMNNNSKRIYGFKDSIKNYVNGRKQIKIFALNEDNILVQIGLPKRTLSGEFIGLHEYKLYLYNYKERTQIEVVDENLVSNGIDTMISYDENMCVLKTGFTLFANPSFQKLDRSEVSIEGVSIVNVSQLISEIMLKKTNIVLNTIDQTYFTKTIPYALVNAGYLIYSKINNETCDETVTFYNLRTKKARTCINRNVRGYNDLTQPSVIGGVPYIKIARKNATQFLNLNKNKIDIEFESSKKIEAITEDIIIVSEPKKSLIGNKNIMNIFRYPAMSVLHTEKANYKDCIYADDGTLYIFVS